MLLCNPSLTQPNISFRRLRATITIQSIILTLLVPTAGFAASRLEAPRLDEVRMTTATTHDSASDQYTYRYTVENGASNDGELWYIKIDISRPETPSARLDSAGFEIPVGAVNVPFETLLSRLKPLALPPGTTIVPIGQHAPPGWLGGIERDGFARFLRKSNAQGIQPGSRTDGFTLVSRATPTIRAVQVMADWVLIVEDEGDLPEHELDKAGRIERNMIFHTHALGPGNATPPGSYDHWNQLRRDIDQAEKLDWFSDANLLATLQSQLQDARTELNAGDGAAAKIKLRELLKTLTHSTPTQRTREAFDLVTLNVQSLLGNTADSPTPREPRLTLTPVTAVQAIGRTHTVTATLVNTANNNAIPDIPIHFHIAEGVHDGVSGMARTNQAGVAEFSYTGKFYGTDRIAVAGSVAASDTHPGDFSTEARVTWKSGADLAIPFFSPPMLTTAGGRRFFISDITENIGDFPATRSTTRYYISNTPEINPTTATMVGERSVEPLKPGESSAGPTMQLTIPAGLPPGDYYFGACADAPRQVFEHNENNNCSFSEHTSGRSIIIDTLP